MSGLEHHGISTDELRNIYQFAVQLGKDAGAILMSSLQQRTRNAEDTDNQAKVEELVMEEKLNAVDIVTETDNRM